MVHTCSHGVDVNGPLNFLLKGGHLYGRRAWMGWRWHDGYHVAGWMDGWVMDGCSYPDHGLILAPPIGCLESRLIIFGPSR